VNPLLANTPSLYERLPIGITMGDAAGIGPELIVKLFAAGLPAPAVVYGDVGILRATARRLGLERRLRIAASDAAHAPEAQQCVVARGAISPTHDDAPRTLAVRSRSPALPADFPLGVEDARAGRAAYDYLCHAIDDAMAQRLRAIVTAPLNKVSLQLGGVDFPGHTEILAQRTHTRDVAMMLANPELRVLLVTIHVAFAEVPQRITPQAELRAIRLAHLACRQCGIASPRIAVAGLNPHAGEQGRFGREDVDVIAPAVAQARTEGLNASGPWPGDTVFMRARRGDFDIVVAQYHDQGLIPVKYLGVDHGVNVTVGLPFIRTSVDHGTAFDIAGKGIANPASLRAAFEMARKMTQSP